MSKWRIEEYIPLAYDALRVCGIVRENNKVDKALRGQIASFGAAVSMGSLLAAIAFFNKASDSGVATERQRLMRTVHAVLLMSDGVPATSIAVDELEKRLFNRVMQSNDEERNLLRERIMDAAVAIRLAMNLYDLGRETETESYGGSHGNG